MTNFANPKAGVFAVSFLPQFVPEGWPVAAVLIGFSVLWALIDLVWYTAVVWTVAAARRALGRPAVRRRLDRLSGVVLVGLGVRLAAGRADGAPVWHISMIAFRGGGRSLVR